jgi:hypothetical protein
MAASSPLFASAVVAELLGGQPIVQSCMFTLASMLQASFQRSVMLSGLYPKHCIALESNSLALAAQILLVNGKKYTFLESALLHFFFPGCTSLHINHWHSVCVLVHFIYKRALQCVVFQYA